MWGKNILEIHGEAVADIQKQGYVHDFNFYSASKRNQLLKGERKLTDFYAHGLPPLAGRSNPNDSTILFAIQKGVFVDASGTYADATMSAMIKRLTIDASTEN